GFAINPTLTNFGFLALDIVTAPLGAEKALASVLKGAELTKFAAKTVDLIRGTTKASEVASKVFLYAKGVRPFFEEEALIALAKKFGFGIPKIVDFVSEEVSTGRLLFTEAKESLTFGLIQEAVDLTKGKFVKSLEIMRELYKRGGQVFPGIEGFEITCRELTNMGRWSVDPATRKLLENGTEYLIEGLPVYIHKIPF
ncbi:MAG: hypothetical protein JNN15_21325, partial [Blastocatellia bacterium]|nr:hypothetical protein [Blastocatellia bacterium]